MCLSDIKIDDNEDFRPEETEGIQSELSNRKLRRTDLSNASLTADHQSPRPPLHAELSE